jgi:pimeloyl-ACP methyl ester carboxylesterase
MSQYNSSSPAQYNHPVQLHFVHHRSPRTDAIPLLFVHGWPGSFLEVAGIISDLTNPPDPDYPAFHVVCPSIPGYGFSPSPRFPGFGYRAAAATFHALMTVKLGYRRYVFQGGDAGDFINRYAAHDFPEDVVSGVSNFWVVPAPPPSGEFPDDEDGVSARAALKAFFDSRFGYAHIHQTRPLRLAIGLTDSPVGCMMWIYDSIFGGIEPERRGEVWTKERVVTWTMMHWLNGPYGAFSLYKHGAKVSFLSPKHLHTL